jgi:hypothetical protein
VREGPSAGARPLIGAALPPRGARCQGLAAVGHGARDPAAVCHGARNRAAVCHDARNRAAVPHGSKNLASPASVADHWRHP